MIIAALVGAAIAVVVTIVAMNFLESEKRIQFALSHKYGLDEPQFLRELGTLLGPAIIDGNRVINYENGVEIFPAMLEAIERAQKSINFETYIYWSGEVGKKFAQALSDRARAGVKVHVLIDWVGSQRMDDDLLDLMKESGVEVEKFHPLHWYNLGRMNNRTHRKLLVVDGRIGFTGGVGIADEWDGDAKDAEHWRDSHYRLEGPAVAQMQAAFMDNWIKSSGQVLQGEVYFPKLEAVGTALGQVFTSSPEGGGDSMQLMYLLAIAAAERTVDISAAYFVPDQLTREGIQSAIKRGVKVRIIVPGTKVDSIVVRKASRAQWGGLLQAGARIFEYQPSMFHCKLLIVDHQLVSVGSTNFDNRSFRLNDEANLNVYDKTFAAHIQTIFESDLAHSKEVTYEAWKARPWTDKFVEKFTSIFSSQL
jgi:cardiolipin synthase